MSSEQRPEAADGGGLGQVNGAEDLRVNGIDHGESSQVNGTSSCKPTIRVVDDDEIDSPTINKAKYDGKNSSAAKEVEENIDSSLAKAEDDDIDSPPNKKVEDSKITNGSVDKMESNKLSPPAVEGLNDNNIDCSETKKVEGNKVNIPTVRKAEDDMIVPSTAKGFEDDMINLSTTKKAANDKISPSKAKKAAGDKIDSSKGKQTMGDQTSSSNEKQAVDNNTNSSKGKQAVNDKINSCTDKNINAMKSMCSRNPKTYGIRSFLSESNGPEINGGSSSIKQVEGGESSKPKNPEYIHYPGGYKDVKPIERDVKELKKEIMYLKYYDAKARGNKYAYTECGNYESLELPPPRSWTFGLWEKFWDPPSLCLTATFCPCITFGKTCWRYKNDGNMEGYKMCNVHTFECCFSMSIGMPYMAHFWQLREMREKYNLKGDGLDDFCLACYCPTCALIRYAKESEAIEEILNANPEQYQPEIMLMKRRAQAQADSTLIYNEDWPA
ncbi:hypothetical protein BS50DRAFT_640057 [Corynespora cassiicola Philippines]|uniref:PLAC8-domain-containing protein n=1 Tax=Corynespora cassiicola Philippines TaxID=1448308 RepID=A0A2T2N5I4_CORCC|nr:hypothetical protein BS50DRAFT_640057 [Corynespora cassiicola Philippines]